MNILKIIVVCAFRRYYTENYYTLSVDKWNKCKNPIMIWCSRNFGDERKIEYTK